MARFHAIGREIERLRCSAAGAREPGEGDIVKINRAQSGCARPRDVGGGLQDVELRSQAGGQIRFRKLERFISGLNIFRFRLEHVLGLFEIEKGAANFRGNRATRRFER